MIFIINKRLIGHYCLKTVAQLTFYFFLELNELLNCSRCYLFMTILMKLPPKVPQQLTHTIFPMPLNLTPDKVVAIIVKESECLTDKTI